MLDQPSTKSNTVLPPVRQAALAYQERGWKVVPIPSGMKHPTTPEWQKQTFPIDRKHFPLFGNVGVQFGPVSNGLCDVDLDCDMARKLAPYFLPKTAAKFGRKSTPAAHWLYVCDAWKSARVAVTAYDDPVPATANQHGA